MGYELQITRSTRRNSRKKRKQISLEAWTAIATADGNLRPVPANGPGFYEMIDGDGWFDLVDGDLQTKNPSPVVLEKAHILAAALQAKVVGDDGEVYLPNGETVDGEVVTVIRYPWWLIFLCLIGCAGYLVVIFHILAG